MLSLLERNIAAIEQRLVVLTPVGQASPDSFSQPSVDKRRHRRLVKEMQRLRGSVYLQDGAIQRSELTRSGRHVTPQDDKSWHLLMVDAEDRVTGCIWYLEHEMPASMDDLRIDDCPLANTDEWRPKLRQAVESDIAGADAERLPYAEVGGWAVSALSQCPAEGFLLAMAAYSLSRKLGGAIGLTTATVRHSSAKILRRLGLAPLEANGNEVPSYFDPRYGCDMEILRFDSRRSSPKYEGPIELIRQRLSQATVISAVAPAADGVAFRSPIFATGGCAA